MKFQSELDAKLFLMEINKPNLLEEVNLEWSPSKELIELFIKRRNKIIQPLRDFRRSQMTKASWRKNRYKIMKGIKSFHKSTAGKRFHRALGRFLATRDFGYSSDLKTSSIFYTEGYREQNEFLKALSSMKTHTYIELDYYHSVDESIDLMMFIEELIQVVDRVEKAVVMHKEVGEEDIEFLIRITETAAIVKSFAEKTGKSEAEVEKMWKEIKKSLIDGGKEEDDPLFYGLLVSLLKKKLGLEKEKSEWVT